MQTLFVMDPLDRIHVEGDSTYVLMLEACRRGYQVWYCTPDDLFLKQGTGCARATQIQVVEDSPWFSPGDCKALELGAFDVVWMRKDPPFDMTYILATYILDHVPPKTLVVNDPKGLKLYNEKIWAMEFDEFHPPTLMSNQIAQLQAFAEENAGRIVLKPWDGNGGRGVLVTSRDDRNLRSMLELLTDNGRNYVIAQPFLEGAERGDKRILLFDGEACGAVLRVPGPADYRGNMHVGASIQACDLEPRDVAICRRLGPELKKHGMVFVGIDVIDGYLTEINVTSPTGIREINRLNGLSLESDLMDTVIQKLSAHQEHA